MRTRAGAWFGCGLGFLTSLVQLFEVYRRVGERLWFMDWILIGILLAAPPFILRRYFRQAGGARSDCEPTEAGPAWRPGRASRGCRREGPHRSAAGASAAASGCRAEDGREPRRQDPSMARNLCAPVSRG
jgi:hypothetical protein